MTGKNGTPRALSSCCFHTNMGKTSPKMFMASSWSFHGVSMESHQVFAFVVYFHKVDKSQTLNQWLKIKSMQEPLEPEWCEMILIFCSVLFLFKPYHIIKSLPNSSLFLICTFYYVSQPVEKDPHVHFTVRCLHHVYFTVRGLSLIINSRNHLLTIFLLAEHKATPIPVSSSLSHCTSHFSLSAANLLTAPAINVLFSEPFAILSLPIPRPFQHNFKISFTSPPFLLTQFCLTAYK